MHLRRLLALLSLVCLLLVHVPTTAQPGAAATDAEPAGARSVVGGWRLRSVERADAFSPPGEQVSTSDTSYTRNILGPPTAEFRVDFPGAPKPFVPFESRTHEFAVTVTGRLTGGRDHGGLYTNDAILLIDGKWPPSRPAVGVAQGCDFDIWGNLVGCSEPARAEGTFTVTFPDASSASEEFRFSVSALNCGACEVEYIYRRVASIDTTEFRCFGRDATVGDYDGDRVFRGTAGDDVIVGSTRADTIHGNGGNDRICARGGGDLVSVGPGRSRVDGGAGKKDEIWFDVPNGDSDFVQISYFRGEGQAHMRVDATTLHTTRYQRFEIIRGSVGDDIFLPPVGDAAVQYWGGQGQDTLDYSATDQPVRSSLQEVDGRQLPQFRQRGRGVVFVSDIEKLVGSRAPDVFKALLPETYGGRGADRIHYRTPQEARLVSGGPNDDVIVLDVVTGLEVKGGPGDDTIKFGAAWVPPTLPNQPYLDVKAVAVFVDLNEGSYEIRGRDPVYKGKISGIETVIGTPGRDVLQGSSDDDTLAGRRGPDILIGRGGRDFLDGGRGRDIFAGGAGGNRPNRIFGGPGRDTLNYQEWSTAVVVDMARGRTVSPIFQATLDRFSGVERIVGTKFADEITGDGSDNFIDGGPGNDKIWGGAGNDEIYGGPGRDRARGGPDTDTCYDVEVPRSCEILDP